jgi:CheY-like chemotaxis protein
MAKVLIVEDDPLMSRMYEKIFGFEKHTVVMAHNGEEGFEKAKTEKPTMILLDVMMPKMNGFQVLDKLKLDPELKNIPVVMLTNLASEKDAENAMLKGAVKYIVKSEHEPKEVVKMVDEILAAHTRDEVPTSDVVQAPLPPITEVAPTLPVPPQTPTPPTNT